MLLERTSDMSVCIRLSLLLGRAVAAPTALAFAGSVVRRVWRAMVRVGRRFGLILGGPRESGLPDLIVGAVGVGIPLSVFFFVWGFGSIRLVLIWQRVAARKGLLALGASGRGRGRWGNETMNKGVGGKGFIVAVAFRGTNSDARGGVLTREPSDVPPADSLDEVDLLHFGIAIRGESILVPHARTPVRVRHLHIGVVPLARCGPENL
jgi:hypothetical protein